MSLAARASLCNRLVFQDSSQRADLLNPDVTKTQLVALLLELVGKGHFLEITAVKTDHHDDSALGLHCHFNGYAADCWPLDSFAAGDYMDAQDPRFQAFLADVARSPWLYQVGLVGDGADSAANFAAAGPTAFQDSGGSHIHLGANGP